MARIVWVVCFLANLACGNMVGTLVEGSMRRLYTKMEVMAKSVQDLYYIQQMNPKHDGIEAEKTCPSIVQVGDRELDLIFYTLQTTLGLEKLKGQPECKYTVTEKDEEIILKAIETPASVKDFYMAIGCELIRGNMVLPEDAIPIYTELVKQDDSVLAGSLAVLGSIMLWKGQPTADLGPLLKVIDMQDMFAQADSFDKQLSFDGDIVATATFVKAAIAIGEYTGTFPLTAEQMVGFGNFVVKGFRPTTARDHFYYMSLISDLQYNKFAQPLHVKMISQKPFHNVNQPIVIGVFAVDGTPKKNAQITARSITRVNDNEVILSNVPFKLYAPKLDEKKEKHFGSETFYDAVYEYKFMKDEPTPGYYDIEIEVSGEKYFSFSDDAIRYRVKVVNEAEIKSVRIGLGTKDKSADTQWHETTLPADTPLSIGRNGRIKVEFDVVDIKTSSSLAVHQSFVRCLNHINHHSVTFIAEQKNGKYSAQFDVTDHFEYGGLHTIHLIVGDAILFPGHIEHIIGRVQVNGVPEPEPGVFATKYLDRYRSMEEIKHTFKEPEPRPPVMISLIFTGACAIPLFGLLVAWGRMGVNINRMESAFMPFHVAIGAVFGLYFMYWFKFNMFTTLKWLAVLGSATFILGNKVLSALATKEK